MTSNLYKIEVGPFGKYSMRLLFIFEISCVLNLLFFALFLAMLQQHTPTAASKMKRSDTIELKKISTPELKKRLRTWGQQHGQKDLLAIPSQQRPTPRPSLTPRPKTNSKLELKDLNIQSLQRPGELTNAKSGRALPRRRSYTSQELLTYQNLDRIHPALSKGKLNIIFDVPEGVPLDKLNSYELKFYAFNGRVLLAYINAINRSYSQIRTENPHFQLSHIAAQTLKAQVFYNSKGQIQKISFLQLSDNEQLQQLFQRALEMNEVPNPPKELLNATQTFSLQYELILKR